MAISLGSGKPTNAAIINTYPKQLRFEQKFDVAYKIRYVYIPRPPALTDLSTAFWAPPSAHQGIYLKFISMVAEDMGAHQLAEVWNLKYQRWLQNAKQQLTSRQLTSYKMEFSHFA